MFCAQTLNCDTYECGDNCEEDYPNENNDKLRFLANDYSINVRPSLQTCKSSYHRLYACL